MRMILTLEEKWLARFPKSERKKKKSKQPERICTLDDEPDMRKHRWLSAWMATYPMPVWSSSPADIDDWLADPRAWRPVRLSGGVP